MQEFEEIYIIICFITSVWILSKLRDTCSIILGAIKSPGNSDDVPNIPVMLKLLRRPQKEHLQLYEFYSSSKVMLS